MPYQFYIFLVAFQGVIFLLHWFIYQTAVVFFGITDQHVLGLMQSAFGLASVSFLLGSMLAFRFKDYFVTIIYRIGAILLGTAYFGMIASCFIWIIYGMTPVPVSSGPFLAALFFGLALAVSIYGLINSQVVRIVRKKIQLKNLPQSWRGKTILFISDTHLGHFRGIHFARRIVKLVNKLQPEMLLIGGDYYDGVACHYERLAAPLKTLSLPHGVYFATGNHEEFEDNTKFLNALRSADVKILDNHLQWIDGLQLIGVDYAETVQRIEYEAILDGLGIERSSPSILIKHVPVDLDIAERAGVSLQLSGHTHHAQIWPFNRITRSMFKGYDYGLKKFHSMAVLVSSGAGTWGPPMRVGTQSEVVLITLD